MEKAEEDLEKLIGRLTSCVDEAKEKLAEIRSNDIKSEESNPVFRKGEIVMIGSGPYAWINRYYDGIDKNYEPKVSKLDLTDPEIIHMFAVTLAPENAVWYSVDVYGRLHYHIDDPWVSEDNEYYYGSVIHFNGVTTVISFPPRPGAPFKRKL